MKKNKRREYLESVEIPSPERFLNVMCVCTHVRGAHYQGIPARGGARHSCVVCECAEFTEVAGEVSSSKGGV